MSSKNFEKLSKFDASNYATPHVSFPSLNSFKPTVQQIKGNGHLLSPTNLTNRYLMGNLNTFNRRSQGLSQSVVASNGVLRRQVSQERMLKTMKIYNDSITNLKR